MASKRPGFNLYMMYWETGNLKTIKKLNFPLHVYVHAVMLQPTACHAKDCKCHYCDPEIT